MLGIFLVGYFDTNSGTFEDKLSAIKDKCFKKYFFMTELQLFHPLKYQ